jgi:4-hydroxybenzoate polyprenyltransferase
VTTAQPVSWADSFRLVAADIKLAHSVFALPFAVLAAFLARTPGVSAARFAAQLALIVLCMVLARTWAMIVNRLVDRRFDAANERTARRVFAAGRLSPTRGWVIALASAALFIAATAAFDRFFSNPWPLILALPVLAWIALYSLTKRFTALCHLVLGTALAASPLAAAIAVDPHPPTKALWSIAGMVLLWVAGFDVIYALQDMDFDRRARLASIPARIGWRGGIWVSRALHAAAVAFLLLAWRSEPRFGLLFALAVAAVAALLVAEHLVLARRGREGLDMAFFTLNGVVSCVLGAAGCIDAAF